MGRALGVVAALGLAGLVVAVPADGERIPSRASLAGVSAIGQVVVSVEGRSKDDEDALRRVAEGRLVRAGVVTDPTLQSQIVASVARRRETSLNGVRHFHYVVSVTLLEPVRTIRTPRTTYRGISWRSESVVTRFTADVPLTSLEDALESRMTEFLKGVEGDTQAGAER